MNSIPLSKKDNKILFLVKILLGLCLAVPLLAWSGVIFPYTVPKVFAFRILVEVAAVFYLYLMLKYRYPFLSFRGQNPSQPPFSKGGEKQNPPLFKGGLGGILGLSILVFFLISFLSALLGIDFYTSFWGNLERGGGVFGLLHFVVWFLMLASVFNGDGVGKEIKENKVARSRGGEASLRDGFLYQLIKISVFISSLISLLAISQHFFGLGNLLPQVDRVYSLIGNAGILGSYLIFNIFLAVYLSLRSSGNQKRVFTIGYWLLAIGLIFSGTRGAWLGLLAGAVVFLIIMAWQPQQKKWRKIAVGCLAVIFVLVASLFVIRDSSFAQDDPILYRLTSISLSGATVQSRLILWQGAWQAWQAKPWLGSGPENFEAAMGPYLSPRLSNFEAYAFDRAHNFIFDYGVEAGWLGLISYLIMIGMAVRALAKSLLLERSEAKSKTKETDSSTHVADAALAQGARNDFYFSATFFSLLVAYLVQGLFIFDSFVSYLMLFFILALISFLRKNSLDNTYPVEAGKQREAGFSLHKKFIFSFIVFCLLLIVYFFNLKPFLAANYASQLLSLPVSEASEMTSRLKTILSLDTFASSEITYQVTLNYIEKISQDPALAQDEEFYSVASTELSRIIERSPNQPRNYIALSWLDLYFSGQQKTRIDQSLQLAQKVQKLSPNKKDAYLLLVAGYSLSSQLQKAAQAVDQALAIDGKMGEEVRGYYNKLR